MDCCNVGHCDDEIEEDGDTDLDEDEEEQNFEEEAFQ
jgi:hypothetical protein